VGRFHADVTGKGQPMAKDWQAIYAQLGALAADMPQDLARPAWGGRPAGANSDPSMRAGALARCTRAARLDPCACPNQMSGNLTIAPIASAYAPLHLYISL